jgi:hypothetical protein
VRRGECQIRRRCNSEVVLAPPAATGAEHARAPAGVTVTLAINATLGEEGFSVADAAAGGGGVLISGGNSTLAVDVEVILTCSSSTRPDVHF